MRGERRRSAVHSAGAQANSNTLDKRVAGTHKGLGITEEQWNTSVRHFTATLDKFSVPAKEKGELLGIVASLKPDTVEKM